MLAMSVDLCWVQTTRKDSRSCSILATNWKPRFEVDGAMSGEAEKDKTLCYIDSPRTGAHTT